MHSAHTAAVLCLFLVAIATASDVVDAKDSDFDAVVAQSDFVLMEFYAPWCGHCKKLAPEWEKAATELKGKAVLAKVDCTVETKTAEKYGIQGYPTIKVFRDGKMAGDYNGGRTADGIVAYVRNNLGPAVTRIADAAAFSSFIEENSIAVVAFTADENTALGQLLDRVATTLRNDYKFALVTDVSIAAGESAETIVMLKNFDERRNVFDGPFEPAVLEKFITVNSVKNFDEIGPENYKAYVSLGSPIGWLFARPSTESDVALRDAVAPLGAVFKGKVSMVWIDADKYSGMAERMAVSSFPGFVIAQGEDKFVLPKDQEISEAAIRSWVQDYVDGKLTKTVRSQPAPEAHTNDLGLTTVVGSTFDELVLGREQDVLIEFYAPWCGHCKQLQPTYQQLAKELRNVNGLRIAQIDAASNDFNTKFFTVKGFPTIYFVPRQGDPMVYEGERSVVGMMTFLKEHSAATFEIPKEPNADEQRTDL